MLEGSVRLTSEVIEVCFKCGVEFYPKNSVELCPHCNAKNSACHACDSWLEEHYAGCSECVSGSRFVEGDH
jgi:hypothetical protein